MAKKKLDKEVERTPSSPGKIAAILKNETVHFVIGLMLVIFPFIYCWLFPLSFSRELPTRVLSTVEIRQTCRRSTIM